MLPLLFFSFALLPLSVSVLLKVNFVQHAFRALFGCYILQNDTNLTFSLAVLSSFALVAHIVFAAIVVVIVVIVITRENWKRDLLDLSCRHWNLLNERLGLIAGHNVITTPVTAHNVLGPKLI